MLVITTDMAVKQKYLKKHSSKAEGPTKGTVYYTTTRTGVLKAQKAKDPVGRIYRTSGGLTKKDFVKVAGVWKSKAARQAALKRKDRKKVLSILKAYRAPSYA